MSQLEYNQSRVKAIAMEIVNQITCLDRWALAAMGASAFSCISESKKYAGGVRFAVNGIRHKGYVAIQLSWVDDYTVTFQSKAGTILHENHSVYCDQLVEVLDWVEGK